MRGSHIGTGTQMGAHKYIQWHMSGHTNKDKIIIFYFTYIYINVGLNAFGSWMVVVIRSKYTNTLYIKKHFIIKHSEWYTKQFSEFPGLRIASVFSLTYREQAHWRYAILFTNSLFMHSLW